MSQKFLPLPETKPLENARHERIAQAISSGERTVLVAYAVACERNLKTEEQRNAWAKDITKAKNTSIRKICNRTDIRQRVQDILQEKHVLRTNTEVDEFHFPKAAVMRSLYENYKKAAAVVPVFDKNGKIIGIYKSDYKAANQSLELLGKELGMFIQQHKHLHQNANPMDGERDEILRSIRVFTDAFSDADLRELGLQRLDTVEAGSRRVNGAGDEQKQTLQAVS